MKKIHNSVNSVNTVKNLITHIKVMYYNNDPILESVEDVNMLYNALCELDEIVGMYEVKDSIVKQIKFLLVNYTNDAKHKFENHMLHTVVYGPPGVGKTTIGACLANIWKGLGLIQKKEDTKITQNIKEIKILPIPIFLMRKNKNNNCNNNYNNDESNKMESNKMESNKMESDKMESDNIEFNIKPFIQSQTDNNEDESIINNINNFYDFREINDSNAYETYSVYDMHKINLDNSNSKNKKNNLHISKNKNKEKIKELKNEIEFLANKEKESLDDKRGYVKELSEYRKQIRELKLLSHGTNNLTDMNNLNKKKSENCKAPLKRNKFDSPIKIVSRPDFVGQYVGHTCDKTQKLLMSTLEEGKVLFIDEAYSIVLDEKDSFGSEAINELNRFMSEHPSLVIIFAGYKDKIESTLFRQQPGLARRISWKFEISNYTGEMLADIFKKQLAKDNWKFEGNDKELNDFFQLKIKNFDAFGGDTLRLAFYCKLKYSELKFDYNTRDTLKDKTITFDLIKNVYNDTYCNNKPEKEDKETWRDLYN